MQLALDVGVLLLFRLDPPVANLGHLTIVALAFGPVGFVLQRLDVDAVLLDAVDQLLLVLPARFLLLLILLQVSDLAAELLELRLIVFALDGLTLDLELGDAARYLVERFGHGIDLHTQTGRRLVHQVDGFVGQEAVGDVARGELHGRDDGVVLDADLVVILILLFQSAEDGDRVCLVRLVHHDSLETPLQSLVFLEILLVLVERRGADGPQFAACQGRLEDVGRVHGAVALACTHQRVDLVDKEDDLPVGLGHLVHYGLESLFELALVLRSSDQCAHVEREDLFALQVFGHVAAHDTVRQSFSDGRLTDARFTDQDRVVLRPPTQDLEHASDLLIASDHGVELTRPRAFVQVDGVFAQRVVRVFGRLAGHVVALPQLVDGRAQLLLGHACVLEHLRGVATLGEERQDDVFERHVLVAHLAAIVHGFLQHRVGLAAEVGLAALHLRIGGDLPIQRRVQPLRVDA